MIQIYCAVISATSSAWFLDSLKHIMLTCECNIDQQTLPLHGHQRDWGEKVWGGAPSQEIFWISFQCEPFSNCTTADWAVPILIQVLKWYTQSKNQRHSWSVWTLSSLISATAMLWFHYLLQFAAQTFGRCMIFHVERSLLAFVVVC